MKKASCSHGVARNAVLSMAAALLLGACTIPGMRLNVTAQGNDEPVVDFRGDASNVDVFAINSETIKRLNDEDMQVSNPAFHSGTGSVLKPQTYRLGPGDILRVTVWDHPELNNPSGTTTGEAVGRIIGADGTMFYPYVGTIMVTGKSTQDVQKFIATALSRVIRDPQVEVNVQTYRSQRIFVTGAVKTPGVQFLTDAPVNASEAIALAGGIDPAADLTRVMVTHEGKPTSINVFDEWSHGDISREVALVSGDVVTVPEARGNKVFVMGEIVKQGSLIFPPGKYSLTDALGDSGGVIQYSSNPAQIYVIRTAGTKPVIFHLNARNPDALVIADDFQLHPRDVIYVEAAEISRIGRVISQILPVASALATGRTIAQ